MYGNTIQCESCSENIYVPWGDKRERRSIARRSGWVYQMGTFKLPTENFNKGDFCPACVTKSGKEGE